MIDDTLLNGFVDNVGDVVFIVADGGVVTEVCGQEPVAEVGVGDDDDGVGVNAFANFNAFCSVDSNKKCHFAINAGPSSDATPTAFATDFNA